MPPTAAYHNKKESQGYNLIGTHCGPRVADAKSFRRNFLRKLSFVLPSFFPLVPGFIEVIVATVFVEVFRVAIVLTETLAAAEAGVGGAA